MKGEGYGFRQALNWHSSDQSDEHKKCHSVLQNLINTAEGKILIDEFLSAPV
jgi:hypothetical protein